MAQRAINGTDRDVKTRPSLDDSFARQCESAGSVEEVRRDLLGFVAPLGFRWIACCSHVNALAPPPGAVMITNLPEAWVERYAKRGYLDCDPIVAAARRQGTPFRWQDPRLRENLSKAQARVLTEAAAFGLRDGVTLPLRGPLGHEGSFSVIVDHDDGFACEALSRALSAGKFAYETARRLQSEPSPTPNLSPRELQVVRLAAAEKKYNEMGALLNISPDTARNTLRNAMKKLDAKSRHQLLLRALERGFITIFDTR